MADQSTVRITIEQLAKLVRQLAATDMPESSMKGIVPLSPGTNGIGGGLVDPLIQANPYRRAIVFQADAQAVGIWFGQLGTPPSSSWKVVTGIDPFLVTFDDIGAAITYSISARGTGVGATINWQEFISPIPLI